MSKGKKQEGARRRELREEVENVGKLTLGPLHSRTASCQGPLGDLKSLINYPFITL